MADVCHLILSFTFYIFASPLSGKPTKLSTAKWHEQLLHDAKKRLVKGRRSAGGARSLVRH